MAFTIFNVKIAHDICAFNTNVHNSIMDDGNINNKVTRDSK